jgi:hypothetical protein
VAAWVLDLLERRFAMKKLVMASLLALGVLVVGQQRASAWSEFKFSAGVNLSWRSSGSCTNFGIYRTSTPYDTCPPFGCASGFPYFGGYAAAPGAESYYGNVAAQAPAAQPAGPAQTYNPYYNSGYQPVGYTYSGYSNYQAPGYWNGR